MTANTLDTALRQFQRGLAQGAAKDTYAGHRALLQFGRPAIDRLELKILGEDWTTLKHPERIHLLSGYIGLIHELDEAASHRIMDSVVAKGCDPGVRSLFNSIRRWTRDDYVIGKAHGCDIWIEKSLSDQDGIREQVGEWLGNVPANDLTGIMRISVVPHVDTMDYAGNYMPVLACIGLVWHARNSDTGWMARISRLDTERTLYHEIGHHCLSHEFGQDSDQEREADRYAEKLFGAAHPKIKTFVTPVARVLYKLIT